MVRHCQICKKSDYLNPEVSFHRIPADPEKRKLWFSILGFEESKKLPKKPDICSDHFDPRDIYTKPNGFHYLRPDALPKLECSVFLDDSTSSSDSTVYDTPKSRSESPQDISLECCCTSRNISSPNRWDKAEDANSTLGGGTAGPYTLVVTFETPKPRDRANEPSTFTSSTITAPEIKEDIHKIHVEESNVIKGKTSKKRKRGYIGDMTISDFSTPEKRRKNMNIIKRTLLNQRRRIHNLQMTVRRLKLRITSQKSLLNYLKR